MVQNRAMPRVLLESEAEDCYDMRSDFRAPQEAVTYSLLPDGSSDFFETAKLGKKLQEAGWVDQALCCYRRALRCKDSTIHTEPTDVQATFADILFDISSIDKTDQTSTEALHLCLDLRRMCMGSNHISVAEVLYRLALIYIKLREYQYAHNLSIEAISILINADESNTKTMKDVWTTLGHVQERLGLFSDSKSSFREAEMLGY